ncbi:MAG TPA: hypothetical protein VEP67_03725 [Thiobacillaceae bacterium]|nr:hypothetical protein [Thiobacillaceae bacterium]
MVEVKTRQSDAPTITDTFGNSRVIETGDFLRAIDIQKHGTARIKARDAYCGTRLRQLRQTENALNPMNND